MGDIKASMSGSPTGPCLVSTVKPGPVPTLDASDLKWQPFYPPLRPALKTMGQCSTKCLLLLWATSADNKSCWSYRLSSVVVRKQVWEEICPQSPGKLERPAWPWCSWASEGGVWAPAVLELNSSPAERVFLLLFIPLPRQVCVMGAPAETAGWAWIRQPTGNPGTVTSFHVISGNQPKALFKFYLLQAYST